MQYTFISADFFRFCMSLFECWKKGDWYIFELKQKITSKSFKYVTIVLAYACYMNQYLTFVDVKKNSEVQKESVVVRLRAPAAILPPESANCMQSRACFSIPLGELIKIKIRLPFAIVILIEAYPTKSLSAQSNLVRWTFKNNFYILLWPKMQDIAVRCLGYF
jgi:hypothetical protein